jgi:hypothetical protein
LVGFVYFGETALEMFLSLAAGDIVEYSHFARSALTNVIQRHASKNKATSKRAQVLKGEEVYLDSMSLDGREIQVKYLNRRHWPRAAVPIIVQVM